MRQGGNAAVINDYSLMPQAKVKQEVLNTGNKSGWVSRLNGKVVADACKLMGAGRSKKGDPINLAVGIVLKGKVGSKIEAGAPIATIYGDSQEMVKLSEDKLREAIEFSDKPVAMPPVVKARISRDAVLS